MPYQWVEPDVFLEYNGRKIYHTYGEDGMGGPAKYWFTTDSAEQPEFEFDVRDLTGYQRSCELRENEDLTIQETIRSAILNRLIEFPDDEEATVSFDISIRVTYLKSTVPNGLERELDIAFEESAREALLEPLEQLEIRSYFIDVEKAED